MKEPETMRDKMMKAVRGEIPMNDFINAWCAAGRWRAIEGQFNISLTFPDCQLDHVGYYWAKKYGGDMRSAGFELHLNLLTGKWHVVFLVNGYREHFCLLDWNYSCERSDVDWNSDRMILAKTLFPEHFENG